MAFGFFFICFGELWFGPHPELLRGSVLRSDPGSAGDQTRLWVYARQVSESWIYLPIRVAKSGTEAPRSQDLSPVSQMTMELHWRIFWKGIPYTPEAEFIQMNYHSLYLLGFLPLLGGKLLSAAMKTNMEGKGKV